MKWIKGKTCHVKMRTLIAQLGTFDCKYLMESFYLRIKFTVQHQICVYKTIRNIHLYMTS